MTAGNAAHRFLPLLAAGLCLAQPAGAQSGSVQFGELGRRGNTVTVPIHISGDIGGGVAAMDFRLHYDHQVLEPVRVEPAATAHAAGKFVEGNVISEGEYIVLMFGMNQNVVGEGNVANVVMRVIGEPESGLSELRISNTTLSGADASGIPSSGSGATLDLRPGQGQPQDPEPPKEDPAQNGTEEPDPVPATPRFGSPPPPSVRAAPGPEDDNPASAGIRPLDRPEGRPIPEDLRRIAARMRDGVPRAAFQPGVRDGGPDEAPVNPQPPRIVAVQSAPRDSTAVLGIGRSPDPVPAAESNTHLLGVEGQGDQTGGRTLVVSHPLERYLLPIGIGVAVLALLLALRAVLLH